MEDFSLLWSIIVPLVVLVLTVGATAKIYLDVTRDISAESPDETP